MNSRILVLLLLTMPVGICLTNCENDQNGGEKAGSDQNEINVEEKKAPKHTLLDFDPEKAVENKESALIGRGSRTWLLKGKFNQKGPVQLTKYQQSLKVRYDEGNTFTVLSGMTGKDVPKIEGHWEMDNLQEFIIRNYDRKMDKLRLLYLSDEKMAIKYTSGRDTIVDVFESLD